MNVFTELKRRNVFRVGAAYVVVAWLLIQVADILLGNVRIASGQAERLADSRRHRGGDRGDDGGSYLGAGHAGTS